MNIKILDAKLSDNKRPVSNSSTDEESVDSYDSIEDYETQSDFSTMSNKSRNKNRGIKKGSVKKRRTCDPPPTATTITSNKFDPLASMDQADDNTGNSNIDETPEINSKKLKPLPAIVVKTVANPIEFIKTVENVVPESLVHFKIGRETISIICYEKTSYDILINRLQKDKMEFHTFTPRSIKEKKAVIKGLDHRYKVEDILADLVSQGLPATRVTHMYKKSENSASQSSNIHKKEAADMFLVFFNHESNISYLFKGQHSRWVCKTGIKWERYTPKSNNITQCWNCQRLGHATINCNYTARCVKCSSTHPRGQCAKQPEDKPFCVNCKEDHPANYRKCKIYVSHIENITKNKISRNNTMPSAPRFNSESFPPISQRLVRPSANNLNQSHTLTNVTYSGALKAKNSQEAFNINEFFETESNNLFGCSKDELYNNIKHLIDLYKNTTDILEKKKLLVTMIMNYGSP